MQSPEMKIFQTFQDMLKVTVVMMKTVMGGNACWESSVSTLVMKMGGLQLSLLMRTPKLRILKQHLLVKSLQKDVERLKNLRKRR